MLELPQVLRARCRSHHTTNNMRRLSRRERSTKLHLLPRTTHQRRAPLERRNGRLEPQKGTKVTKEESVYRARLPKIVFVFVPFVPFCGLTCRFVARDAVV